MYSIPVCLCVVLFICMYIYIFFYIYYLVIYTNFLLSNKLIFLMQQTWLFVLFSREDSLKCSAWPKEA